MTEKKRTLAETALFLVGGSVVGMGIVLMVIPIDLALAWLRVQVWEWFFVPYLHAPHISVWLMFAIMLFISMFRKNTRELKNEYYSQSGISSLLSGFAVEGVTFLILYGVHLWVLKG